jgi:sulfonate transport system ATP-binding protein
MTAGLEIRGLSKSFVLPDRTVRVLDGLDLVQRPGITVILGASGCGKTTLLRLVAGLETPDTGTVDTHGARIGVVFQEPRLMPWLTTVQNIRFGLGRGLDTARLVAMTGLGGFEQALPHQLSGGMAHRVALARALADEPTLVLMDEPFAALDQITREAMQDQLLRLQRAQGMNVLFVTHSIAEALYLGDRVVVLEDGRIAADHDVTHDPAGRIRDHDPDLTAVIRSTIQKDTPW